MQTAKYILSHLEPEFDMRLCLSHNKELQWTYKREKASLNGIQKYANAGEVKENEDSKKNQITHVPPANIYV